MRSTNGARTTVYPYAKERVEPFLLTIHKNELKKEHRAKCKTQNYNSVRRKYHSEFLKTRGRQSS